MAVHVRLVGMLVAGDTGKLAVVRRDVVTVGAGGPLAVVPPGIDREIRSVVVERGPGPGHGRVTGRAIGREAGLLVIRVRGPLVVRLVTGVAESAQPVVDPAGMACGAVQGRVGPGQREARLRMVVDRPGPAVRVVALLAGSREPRLLVVRVVGTLLVRLVAGVAEGAQPVVDAAGVTRAARGLQVRTGQREVAVGMVERRRNPRRGTVAHGAVGREPALGVIRVRGSLVVRLVARVADGAEAVVDAAGVAGRAGRRRVGPGQREARLRVVVDRPGPAVVLWHCWQAVENPACWWFGSLVPCQSAWWQE